MHSFIALFVSVFSLVSCEASLINADVRGEKLDSPSYSKRVKPSQEKIGLVSNRIFQASQGLIHKNSTGNAIHFLKFEIEEPVFYGEKGGTATVKFALENLQKIVFDIEFDEFDEGDFKLHGKISHTLKLSASSSMSEMPGGFIDIGAALSAQIVGNILHTDKEGELALNIDAGFEISLLDGCKMHGEVKVGEESFKLGDSDLCEVPGFFS